VASLQEDGTTWLPVYKTEVVANNLNPNWKQINIGAVQLCNADMYRPLRLRVGTVAQPATAGLVHACPSDAGAGARVTNSCSAFSALAEWHLHKGIAQHCLPDTFPV
jgi:hypothetical protein